jgi:carbonic anhydrase
VGYDTFVGMESLIFNAKIENNVALGVFSTITGGVEVPDNNLFHQEV